jgi:hypothetical protein
MTAIQHLVPTCQQMALIRRPHPCHRTVIHHISMKLTLLISDLNALLVSRSGLVERSNPHLIFLRLSNPHLSLPPSTPQYHTILHHGSDILHYSVLCRSQRPVCCWKRRIPRPLPRHCHPVESSEGARNARPLPSVCRPPKGAVCCHSSQRPWHDRECIALY